MSAVLPIHQMPKSCPLTTVVSWIATFIPPIHSDCCGYCTVDGFVLHTSWMCDGNNEHFITNLININQHTYCRIMRWSKLKKLFSNFMWDCSPTDNLYSPLLGLNDCVTHNTPMDGFETSTTKGRKFLPHRHHMWPLEERKNLFDNSDQPKAAHWSKK